MGMPNLKYLLSSSFVSDQMSLLVSTVFNHVLLFPSLLSCASRAASHHVPLLLVLPYSTASALGWQFGYIQEEADPWIIPSALFLSGARVL